MIIFWHPAGVQKLVLFILPITLQPLGTHKPTIYQIKGDIHSFHLRYGSLVFIHRLQSYRVHKALNISFLVIKSTGESAAEGRRKRKFQILFVSSLRAFPCLTFAEPKKNTMVCEGTLNIMHACMYIFSHPSYFSINACLLFRKHGCFWSFL